MMILSSADLMTSLFMTQNSGKDTQTMDIYGVMLSSQHIYVQRTVRLVCNDLTIEWENLNPLIHPKATLAPYARQARASGENLNYVTLGPQARPSGEFELLAESLV